MIKKIRVADGVTNLKFEINDFGEIIIYGEDIGVECWKDEEWKLMEGQAREMVKKDFEN